MVSLGIHTEGELGERRLPEGLLTRLVCFTLWTLGRGHASRLHLQILAGRWVRAQQMRRATSGVFDRLWHHIAHSPVYGNIPFLVASELLAACCWCPFYLADLRQMAHGTVTCSAASMSGAGICFSSGLSRCGSRLAEEEPVGMRRRPTPAIRAAGLDSAAVQ